MTKNKKHKERIPEEDKNNVAYYKKNKNNREDDVSKEKEEPAQRRSGDRVSVVVSPRLPNQKPEPNPEPNPEPESTTMSSTPNKSWSQIAGINIKSATRVMPPQRKIIKIKPEFESESVGYDRIVVTPTYFNNKPFNGFITEEEADIINMAIGLQHLDNHHGTSFYRNEKNVLFITYKLKRNIQIQKIYKSIHQHFWFDKTSKAGNHDKISGQVVHPPMDGKVSVEDTKEQSNCARPDYYTSNWDDKKEIRIDGCNYEMSESEITGWIKQYGEIKSELEEIAISGPTETPVGTGSYTIKVRLNRLIPNVLPMHGLKIKCLYQGVKKQCSNCYGYHRPEGKNLRKQFNCEGTTFEEYKEKFKADNPNIPLTMLGIASEALQDISTEDYDNSEGDECEEENNDETDNQSTYFNYMYSYDFTPEWAIKQ